MSTVSSSSSSWGRVDLDVGNDEGSDVELSNICIRLCILEEVQEIEARLLWPPDLRSLKSLSLCASSNSSLVDVEWNCTFVFDNITKIFLCLNQSFVSDCICSFDSVFKVNTEILSSCPASCLEKIKLFVSLHFLPLSPQKFFHTKHPRLKRSEKRVY